MNKSIIRICNIASTLILILGVFSKNLHYPGAAAEIVLSTALIIVLTCIDCITIKDKFNILMGLSICVLFVAALFKAQHWPFSSALAGFGVGLSIFISLLMSFRKENSQLSQQNGLSVFLLLVFIITLMANNPVAQLLGNENKSAEVVQTVEVK